MNAIDAALQHLRAPPRETEPSPLYPGFVRVGERTLCPCSKEVGARDWGCELANQKTGEVKRFYAVCRACGKDSRETR